HHLPERAGNGHTRIRVIADRFGRRGDRVAGLIETSQPGWQVVKSRKTLFRTAKRRGLRAALFTIPAYTSAFFDECMVVADLCVHRAKVKKLEIELKCICSQSSVISGQSSVGVGIQPRLYMPTPNNELTA